MRFARRFELLLASRVFTHGVQRLANTAAGIDKTKPIKKSVNGTPQLAWAQCVPACLVVGRETRRADSPVSGQEECSEHSSSMWTTRELDRPLEP
jgi:hypothetical protein